MDVGVRVHGQQSYCSSGADMVNGLKDPTVFV